MSRPSNANETRSERQWFATTHWSVFLSLRDIKAAKASEALEKLCRTYWPPRVWPGGRAGFDPGVFRETAGEEFLGSCRSEKGALPILPAHGVPAISILTSGTGQKRRSEEEACRSSRLMRALGKSISPM